jgi:preprotein translocase subunit SecA
MHRWLSQVLGRTVEHDLSPYAGAAAAVAGLEPVLGTVSDEGLAEQARALRRRVQDGAAATAVVAEGFALVREAARRALRQRPFDVQILAGLAMHRGRIAELATGEGKTLAAVTPAFLAALDGRGAHVLTFNDYLARRDARWMGPVYERLGLSVGHVEEGMTGEERRRGYASDVTYVTAREAGFDYLRDGLALAAGEQGPPPLPLRASSTRRTRSSSTRRASRP